MSMSFKFTVPNLYLSKYCFNGSNIVNGYVRPGATAECICYLDSTGYPPAFLQWSNSSNIDLGNHLNNTAITLPIEPNNNLVTYSCSRVTQLQNGNGSTFYTVHYAISNRHISTLSKTIIMIYEGLRSEANSRSCDKPPVK
uniref:Ig-like domain-containing protein n=1 Tax=Biomphalaria glabrata TaxID=6526 RepID=A0A2C9LV72_BIOGL